VFVNRELRGDEVKGDLRELHSEERHDFYSSPIITRVNKWRMVKWGGGMWNVWGGGEAKDIKNFGRET
jgi:hypothetical protein